MKIKSNCNLKFTCCLPRPSALCIPLFIRPVGQEQIATRSGWIWSRSGRRSCKRSPPAVFLNYGKTVCISKNKSSKKHCNVWANHLESSNWVNWESSLSIHIYTHYISACIQQMHSLTSVTAIHICTYAFTAVERGWHSQSSFVDCAFVYKLIKLKVSG